ncbi:hypothetical protein CDD82_6953 [Ophiocordyceps australis]|uniref:Serine carboxypeptidase S28 n=1 Tax=Ophiocordyceps australis TaxID=1399860 RepID=A0A2C5XY07_9HYPO|nr:hypothetical protein CDD82_6953 [Ophiocordyceps australis]
MAVFSLLAALVGLVAAQSPPPASPSPSPPPIKAYNLSVPVDHFHNESKYEPHSSDFFNLRYWLDTSNYRPGGPVIVLHSGETSSEDRLPYLEHGIVPELTAATGGVGLVLEHRYYGTSYPTANVTTQSLRFLTSEQALADTAYFAQHVTFPGLEHVSLTAAHAPWIIYGGSYAGALAALARKLYPDVFWGGISSSGVTAAVDDYWQYFEAARHAAPGDCSATLQRLVHVIDAHLCSGDQDRAKQLKELFGLGELWNDEFADTIKEGIEGLQSTNWDPNEDDAKFGLFCASITSDARLFASTAHLVPRVRQAVSSVYGDNDHHGVSLDSLVARMLNYIGFVRDSVRKSRAGICKDKSQRQCYSSRLLEDDTSISSSWFRSWTYQTCTQWGYFVTGSGVPQDRLPLVSRALTYEYASVLCQRFFNITARPDVESINRHGGFEFSYPRLAIIDGAQDPWREATPHATGHNVGRGSSVTEPFLLIDWGVHHWDEYGLPLAERAQWEGLLPPPQVVGAQREEVRFVRAWLEEWKGRVVREVGEI